MYDAYSRFVDIEVMDSTKGIDLKHTLDKVWGTHGYCHMLVSDNGPPYNSHNFKIYCKSMGESGVAPPTGREDGQDNPHGIAG